MKKYIAVLLSFILCFGLLAGCGKNYSVEESTLFILKDGKIISTDVEDFGSSYDEAALKEYVDSAIKEYTDEYGEETVKLKELKVEEGKATLIIEYASAGDYTSFTDVELFSGTILDALSAGYTFKVDFASISDGTALACSNQDIIQDGNLKVVIFKGNGNVNIKGKIVYASVENTKLIDDDTLAVSSDYNLLGLAVDAASDTEETVADTDSEFEEENEYDYVDEDIDEGSVSEDDLLSGSAEVEESEVEFEFEDVPEDIPEEAASVTSVYTYIIYK